MVLCMPVQYLRACCAPAGNAAAATFQTDLGAACLCAFLFAGDGGCLLAMVFKALRVFPHPWNTLSACLHQRACGVCPTWEMGHGCFFLVSPGGNLWIFRSNLNHIWHEYDKGLCALTGGHGCTACWGGCGGRRDWAGWGLVPHLHVQKPGNAMHDAACAL